MNWIYKINFTQLYVRIDSICLITHSENQRSDRARCKLINHTPFERIVKVQMLKGRLHSLNDEVEQTNVFHFEKVK